MARFWLRWTGGLASLGALACGNPNDAQPAQSGLTSTSNSSRGADAGLGNDAGSPGGDDADAGRIDDEGGAGGVESAGADRPATPGTGGVNVSSRGSAGAENAGGTGGARAASTTGRGGFGGAAREESSAEATTGEAGSGPGSDCEAYCSAQEEVVCQGYDPEQCGPGCEAEEVNADDYGCLAEYLALRACGAELDAADFDCFSGSVSPGMLCFDQALNYELCIFYSG